MQRNQNQQWGSRRWQGQDDDRSNRYRNRERDEGRYSSAEDERYYGSYVENDEGDSSVRAGNYDQGRSQYGQRGTQDQSGSTGRYAGYGNFGEGDYGGRGRGGSSGQDRYGQSGYGQGGYGQSGGRYRGGDFGREERWGSSGWSEPYGEGQQYGSRAAGAGYQSGGSQQYGFGRGLHRGKGPRGYQRSDERLMEMICERLREDPYIDASDVTVTVQSSKVTFDGAVDSRHTKNLIEDVAEQLGVDDVQNNLRVQRQDQGRSEAQQGRSASGAGTTTGTSRVGSPGAGSEDEQTKKRSN
jgi:osmotically-inducible protein OsmY